jgi:hypothetical protein
MKTFLQCPVVQPARPASVGIICELGSFRQLALQSLLVLLGVQSSPEDKTRGEIPIPSRLTSQVDQVTRIVTLIGQAHPVILET